MWRPQGGERRAWRDLVPGDRLELDREVWRVREVRLVPVADWDEGDQRGYQAINGARESEEDWQFRPVYLVLAPARGGKLRHVKVRPYRGPRAYVLPSHYPVCSECGDPWPCRDLEIDAEAGKQMAEVARLESILPGCCWKCGEPVTSRQKSIAFEGENLLLPGGPPVVFHLRRGSPYCSSAAVDYDKRWVAAEEGRHPRLYCPGRLVVHVDGRECSEDPYCPEDRVQHSSFWDHRGSAAWVRECLRCMDACEQRGIVVPEVPA
jgi:hypothetical protein